MQSSETSDKRDITHRVELLAPAGDWEALKAACACGADAVYFGLPVLNARLRAGNFQLSDLPALMEYLHIRNVRGYLAMNTLVYQHELAEAQRAVAEAARASVDALIVQDYGLAVMARRMVPSLKLHASTQMTLSSPGAIAHAAKLGFSRVILPREIPLAEIRKIAAETGIELEVFVHGALCISYSGQCQASLALGGRSANRGECAQPCRLPYAVIADGIPPSDGSRPYPLSPHDLAAWELIPQLVDAGVISFKIEGRLKNSCYVAAAVRLYRSAIDAALAGRVFTPDPEDETALRQTFSRGFSCGFLGGAGRTALVDGLSSKPRGVRIGSVLEVRSSSVILRLETDGKDSGAQLRPGDGVVLSSGISDEHSVGGRVQSVRPIINRGAKAGQCGRMLEVVLWSGDGQSLNAEPGATLWKTDDPQQEKRLKATYAQEKIFRRSVLNVSVEARAGEVLRTRWCDEDGHSVEVFSDVPLEPAENSALTEETLSEQFNRLGDTPFVLGEVKLSAAESVMAPKSILNSLRRKATGRLVEMRRTDAVHSISQEYALSELLREANCKNASQSQENLSVLVRSSAQAYALLQSGAYGQFFAWLDLTCSDETVAVAAAFRAAGRPFGLATPRITRSGEEGRLEALAELKPNALLLRSAAAHAYFSGRNTDMQMIGDAFLHVANSISAVALLREGLTRVTPAYELTLDEIVRLASVSGPACMEIPVYLHLPMFYSEHCLFAFRLDGEKKGACSAACRDVRLELLDRKGAQHSVIRDESCRNTVFASTPRDWRNGITSLRNAGLHSFRIELLHEDPPAMFRLLDSIKTV